MKARETPMNEEPRYVDPDDPWEDEQTNKDKTNLAGVSNLDLLGKLRGATGRKTDNDFASPKEKRRYLLIDKQHGKGMIPDGWIDQLVGWAQTKNKGKTAVVIMFPALVSAILNKARMQDWINTQPISKVSMEKYSDPDAFD